MNFKPFLLSLALLLSSSLLLANCSDLSGDRASATCQRLLDNDNDIKVALAYLFTQTAPKSFNCDFAPYARAAKTCEKYFVNRFLVNDSIDFSIDLPAVGQFNVINTDQALEVAYELVHGLLAKYSSNQLLNTAGKVYLREKVVAALLWALQQTGLENLLPDSLTDKAVYAVIRDEVARYETDKYVVNPAWEYVK